MPFNYYRSTVEFEIAKENQIIPQHERFTGIAWTIDDEIANWNKIITRRFGRQDRTKNECIDD